MRTSILILAIGFLISLSTHAQEIKRLDEKWYADRIHTRQKDLQSFKVDLKREYVVSNEGEAYVQNGQRSITSADLVVNNDPLTTIINAEAYKHGDTLDILIYNENDPSHDHNFQIQVIGEKCFMVYDFSYPMDEANRKLVTVEFGLTLSTKEFKTGSKVRGFVNYLGKCIEYCPDSYKDVEVHGGFVVAIK